MVKFQINDFMFAILIGLSTNLKTYFWLGESENAELNDRLYQERIMWLDQIETVE